MQCTEEHQLWYEACLHCITINILLDMVVQIP